MEREIAAIERIERALARLEQSADRSSEGEASAAEVARLQAAHDRLRGRVQQAIGEIDALLAGRGGSGA